MGGRRSVLALYDEEYVQKGFERLDLLRQLAVGWGVRSVLYPGSFVHVTPSFVIPVAIYVDTDTRARRFFDDPALGAWLSMRKEYEDEPQISFLPIDYRTIGKLPQRVDLLLSQHAGLVSKNCSRFLKRGGLLLANDSHGDASFAQLSAEFELVAVVHRRAGRHRIATESLDRFFILKGGRPAVEQIETRGRGFGYTKAATAYLFRKSRAA